MDALRRPDPPGPAGCKKMGGVVEGMEERYVKGKRVILIGLALGMIPWMGCSLARRQARRVYLPQRNLVFNPAWTGLGVLPFARSDWPTTSAYSHPRELIDYQETFYDRQGETGSQRDHLIRRFYSVRTGRARR